MSLAAFRPLISPIVATIPRWRGRAALWGLCGGIYMRRGYLLFPLLVAGGYSPALAQDAGALLRDREQQGELKLPKKRPAETAEQPTAQPSVAATQRETILIKTVRFSGQVSLLTEAERVALARRVEGRQVGFADIRALADAANTSLRQQGRLLARAIIPPQDATAGTLTIEIIEGKLQEITFTRGKGVRIRETLLRAIADGQVRQDALTKDDLEGALLRMNDLSGVTARSRLAAGTAAGTSRLMVDVSEEPVLSASLYGDNFGSPSTGRAQGHAQIAISDLTGRGELTELGFSYSDGQRYASASVAVPLTASGLGLFASYGYLSYENVDAIGQAAGLEGEAHYGSVGLRYQIHRSRDFNLRLSAALNGKALTDDSTAGRLADKRVVSGTVSVTSDVHDEFLEGATTQLSASWTMGDLDLSRVPVAALVDTLGLKTQGTFHRLNADLLRLQRLSGAFSLLTRVSGQWASKNLDSSESFSLGGPYGVRGWPVGEGRGDAAITGTVELRYDVPLDGNLGALQFATFLDSGHIWLNKHTYGIPLLNACACNDYSLTSAGASMSWRHRHFSLAGSWAYGLGQNKGRSVVGGLNADGKNDRQQFWLSGSISF